MKKLIIILLFLLLILFISPIPSLSYIEQGCIAPRGVVCTGGFRKVVVLKNSILRRIISKSLTKRYPKYGYASDFSWVAGRIEFYELEGGCTILEFSNDTNAPHHGLLAISKEQAGQYDLIEGRYVVLEGKLGESRFSMSCPPQNYIIERIL